MWDKAIADYSTAIEKDPRYADAYCNRGAAWYNLGQLEKAIADYSRALEIDPGFAAALSNRELAYRKLKNSKK